MMDFITDKILAVAVPILTGPLAYLIMRHAKRALVFIDKQSPTVKRVLLYAISFALVVGTQAAGISLPPECKLADDGLLGPACFDILTAPVFAKATAVALLGHLLHVLKKSRPDS